MSARPKPPPPVPELHRCSVCSFDTANQPTPRGNYICCSCQINNLGRVVYGPPEEK